MNTTNDCSGPDFRVVAKAGAFAGGLLSVALVCGLAGSAPALAADPEPTSMLVSMAADAP